MKMMKLVFLFDETLRWIAATVLIVGTTAANAGEVEHGREVFKQCEGCHSVEPGVHLFGPSLAGVFGRSAGKLEGYEFSEALQASNFKWDEKHLNQWLSDEPKNMVEGTRMEFPGMPDSTERRALITFLKSVSRQ